MEHIINLLFIGVGGFIGAVLRYLVSSLAQFASGSAIFPYGTLCVNLVGCFVIGVFSLIAETRGMLSMETRMFLLIGLLGSFTTFSTFGNETFNLFREGRPILAGMNAVAHLAAGLLCVWFGRLAAIFIWR